MKLKNLLFATMVACAFTACSESDPVSEVAPPVEEAAEATISFKASATSLLSKADPVTDAGAAVEKKISSLTVLVFQQAEGNAYITSKTIETPKADEDGVYSIEDVKVKASSVSVLLVANVADPSIFTGKNLAACEALTVDRITASTDDNFVMSTAKFNGNLTAGKTNCFGYSAAAGSETDVTSNSSVITLYRVAARVQLDKVTVRFDQTTDLKGAKLDITNVFMSNVRASSKYMSNTLGSIENTAATWECGVAFDEADVNGLLVDGDVAVVNGLNKAFEQPYSIISAAGEVSSNLTGVQFYVLENAFGTEARGDGNAYTLLIIQANLYKMVDGKLETTPAVRYYAVKVNEAVGTTGAGAGTGKILRNNIYKIENATLTGTGSDKAYDPEASMSVSAKVVVAPWNVVTQAPEIE